MEKLSWKTTLGGIAALLTGIGMLGKVINDFLLGEPVSFEQVTIAISAIGAGVAGIAARDNNVSSEDVGVR
ncbi:MAG TPA: hypothetical protein VIL74_20715 [Pyrinomonadaceae bacterium]|jgi:hypothetical protein